MCRELLTSTDKHARLPPRYIPKSVHPQTSVNEEMEVSVKYNNCNVLIKSFKKEKTPLKCLPTIGPPCIQPFFYFNIF